MKTFAVLAILVMLSTAALAQVDNPLSFMIQVTDSSADTTAWIDTEGFPVSYTASAYDSSHFYIIWQASDTLDNVTLVPTGGNVPRFDMTRTVGEDSMANIANTANPHMIIANVLRSYGQTTDKMKGARYLRGILVAPSVAAKKAAAAADQWVRLIVHRRRIWYKF